jgi:UDP-N-acetylglucosamine 2-epimerase (non-hydrolysing)
MSDGFLESLRIDPSIIKRLPFDGGGMSLLHTFARVSTQLEPVLEDFRPDWCVVVGDVTSTAAAALAAKYHGIRVAHVEAGLRSFDQSMPEEINRMVTDSISDLLLCSEDSGVTNLLAEGKPSHSVLLVGNVMIDSLKYAIESLQPSEMAVETRSLLGERFGFCTLHRPSNVDRVEDLRRLLDTISTCSAIIGGKIVMPIHPRTENRIKEFGLQLGPGIHRLPALRYEDALFLMRGACVVLTDSGGIQEETTWLGIPCVTLRENTERPATCTYGTNRIAGVSRDGIMLATRQALSGSAEYVVPPFWDGNAAERIVNILLEEGNR